MASNSDSDIASTSRSSNIKMLHETLRKLQSATTDNKERLIFLKVESE